MILALAAPAFAGAWTKDLGQAYAKAYGDLYATSNFVAQGQDAGGSYLGQQYGVYAEAGVLPFWKTQLVVSFPLVIGSLRGEVTDPFGTKDVIATSARTGDLRVGAQVALHPKIPLALAVDLKVPTYANGGVGDGYAEYQDYFPKPGDGQVDVGATLMVGLSPWDGGFVELAAGGVHRTEWFVGWETELELADGLRFGAKAGHRVKEKVLPILAAEAVITPDPTPATRSFVNLAASALFDVKHGLAIEPRLNADLWTQNTSRGIGVGVGLSWRR